MNRFHLWREKILNVEKSAEARSMSYDLGQCKGGYVLRIPKWLAFWFTVREARRRDRQALQEEIAVMREIYARDPSQDNSRHLEAWEQAGKGA